MLTGATLTTHLPEMASSKSTQEDVGADQAPSAGFRFLLVIKDVGSSPTSPRKAALTADSYLQSFASL